MADYFTASADPADNSDLDSSVIRAEFAAIAAGFVKIAGYTGAGNRVLFINAGATAQSTDSAFTYNATTDVLTVNTSTFGLNTSIAGTLGITGALTYGGVALTAAVTGTGKMVLDTGPTINTSLVAGGATFALVNTTATTVNFAGAATTLNIGNSGGTTTHLGNTVQPAVSHKFGSGDIGDVTVQLGTDSATNYSTRIALFGASVGSGYKNWFISTNWNTAGALEFSQSTAAGGATMAGTAVMTLDTNGFLSLTGTTKSISLGVYQGRSLVESTNALNLSDGTAPSGTMANGVTLYSASGEMRSMDAAGNSTLLSPHNEAGDWIYDSVSPVTGRHLRVDMEKLVKAVNDAFGWDFVHETDVVS